MRFPPKKNAVKIFLITVFQDAGYNCILLTARGSSSSVSRLLNLWKPTSGYLMNVQFDVGLFL